MLLYARHKGCPGGDRDFIMPCTGGSARKLEADRHPDSSLPLNGVITLLLPVLGIRSKGKKDGREKVDQGEDDDLYDKTKIQKCKIQN